MRKAGVRKGKWSLNGFVEDFPVLGDNHLEWRKQVIFEKFSSKLINEIGFYYFYSIFIEMKLGDC